ncbi:hypothetical protein E4U43_008687 [Claviceps pusilla]|uniref:Dehydrogenase FUB6 n=1 Tax=Claviceps pusilla TaxID=123648 RepID=A0A9P7NAA8_9HYPO|nr:hypothetical protein E4U43_008687 [Claviceps pusilla]
MKRENTSVVLAERPTDNIIPGQTFNIKKSPIPSPSDLKDGEILVQILYLSLDPAMRGWLNDTRSYIPPVKIGAIMRGASVARVLASKSSLVSTGEFVSAMSGWTEFAVLNEEQFEPASAFPGLNKDEPQDILSILGLTGATAWWGMTQIGDPKPGDLVVVSGAAGATGSVAGQIAKIKGATVVGICGSDSKCQWLVDDLGFDVALNYKAADFKDKFKAATKSYIDVYFDNVGGDILDMCLARAKEHSRFVMCGGISQYNTSNPVGPKNISKVITMRIKMQGFIVFDHKEHIPAIRKELSQWLAEGKMKKTETVVKGGLAAAQQALVDLYRGTNQGKLLVEVQNPAEAAPKL